MITVADHLRESAAVKLRTVEACTASILLAAELIVESFRGGGKLLLCGNGGSAADCQHMAAEFTSRLSADFVRPGLPAIALTTDTSFLTAYANGFDSIRREVVSAGGRFKDGRKRQDAASTVGRCRHRRPQCQHAARSRGPHRHRAHYLPSC